MSSLFSYELDEAQIRLTLQNSKAVDYHESMWDDFESNYVQSSVNHSQNKFKFPDFHLNINRNVVLPVVFIAALVGISAVMLSFVDFKTNAPKEVEKGLIPNPDNFKPSAKTAALVKKEPEKPVVAPIKTDSVKLITNPVVNTQTQVAVNNNTVIDNYSVQTPTVNQEKTAETDTASVAKSENQPVLNTINQSYPGKSRKRRRKIPTEQIETIKAPSILGVETSTKEKEPELEIKLN
ncbi:MAG TPA: hypothetical protein VN026_00360 [Bacteroidia bacterium]|jgi:hypothetical protein|nr:hypothetical protein [Bacteroidia bacterium]